MDEASFFPPTGLQSESQWRKHAQVLMLLLICAIKDGPHENCTVKLDPNINLYLKH